jgi:non-specific serine/threonine protein kinase
MIGETLGHYRIEKRIGAGGMGMVYAARDSRLERPVALKVIHEGFDEPGLRERMWREARAAAALNHPAVCQVHEIGEDAGRLFIVMELLDGQTLEDRVHFGALDLDEALRIGITLLDALDALHRRGLIHRDIKPSNVFLLADGRVKLLDFGLVRPAAVPLGPAAADSALTRPGIGIGSPGYMAPEQVLGQEIDARIDLFSLAVVLHEAVSGQRAFTGGNAIEIMHAALSDTPPPLRGSGRMETLGRILAQGMARERDDRFASAGDMATALRALQSGTMTTPEIAAPRLTRLAVLPFRMLRPNPDFDFLGPSLADAIALSLAGIKSLVVRSTMATSRFADAPADLEELRRALDVDVVLSGTLLAAGDRCRLSAQLVEVPLGRVRWSEMIDVSASDIFELQDNLTRRIVDSLRLPLSNEERGGLYADTPANATAYELYLRGSQYATLDRDPAVGRDLLVRAIEADPGYAPAWARLGHVYRLLGKYHTVGRRQHYTRAAEATARALELHPGLPLAHLVQAHIDLDQGRTERALDDLLGVVERNPNHPLGYQGLVTAFRYTGMIEESHAAHRIVRELDPEIRTSLEFTLVLEGRFDEAAKENADGAWDVIGWAYRGQRERAPEFEAFLSRNRSRLDITFIEAAYYVLVQDRERTEQIAKIGVDFPDPEGLSFRGTMLHMVGHPDAMAWLRRSVENGFYAPTGLMIEPLKSLRGTPDFEALLAYANRRSAESRRAVEPRWQAILARRTGSG